MPSQSNFDTCKFDIYQAMQFSMALGILWGMMRKDCSFLFLAQFVSECFLTSIL